jgi:hypothetical protein
MSRQRHVRGGKCSVALVQAEAQFWCVCGTARPRSSVSVGARCVRVMVAPTWPARPGLAWYGSTFEHARRAVRSGAAIARRDITLPHTSPVHPIAWSIEPGRGVGPVLPRRVRVGSRRLTRECRQLGPRVGWIVEMTADHAARQYDPADRDGGNSASGHEGQRGDHRDRAVPVDVPQGPCQQAGRSSRGSRRARWR